MRNSSRRGEQLALHAMASVDSVTEGDRVSIIAPENRLKGHVSATALDTCTYTHHARPAVIQTADAAMEDQVGTPSSPEAFASSNDTWKSSHRARAPRRIAR
jgi:hypothetical protein